jgi:protein subunit release factor A
VRIKGEVVVSAYRPGPVGGQQVGATAASVKAVHVPTGIGVVVENERSLFVNKVKALSYLTTLLAAVAPEWTESGE